MADVEQAVVDVIDTAVAALTEGVNLFYGPERAADEEVPDEAVFAEEIGGPAPTVYQDGGSGTNLNNPSVLIIVRSPVGDRASGKSLANDVYSAVRKSDPADTIGARALQSGPIPVKQTEQGHFRWTINLAVWKRE